MRIAIVEDEPAYAQQLKEYLQRYQEEFQQTLQVSHYPSGLALLQSFQGQFDLILLDISMPGIDGMETARRIRTTDDQVILLFVTNLAQYAIRGYEVDAMDYILKPISYFAFSQRLNRALSRVNRRTRQFLAVVTRVGTRKVAVDTIQYVESIGHDLIFHTTDGDIRSTGTMRDAEQRLAGHSFFRCNKGYLVSLEYVDGVKDGCALVGGQELLISRPRKNAFLEALTNYIGGQQP